MTVVGDIAQATGPWAPHGWNDVTTHLSPRRRTRLVELTVSYRTPAEVVATAARVLARAAPDIAPPRPVRRSGMPPRLERALPGHLAERAAVVAAEELAAIGSGRVAVLAPSVLLPELSRSFEVHGLDPVDPRDPAGEGLAAPLILLPADEANGLEFDAVVVVEPALVAAGPGAGEGPAAPTVQGLRTLYVAMTRPTRRLALVSARPLPVDLEG
jgi:DNA helicase IV